MRSSTWAEGKTRWLEAMRWRRQIEKLLKPFELTLARWLVLEATDELGVPGHAHSGRARAG